jgi:hypothetical protein
MLNVDFQVDCINKFLDKYEFTFVYVKYKRIDMYNCKHIYTGSYEINGNTEYVNLFEIEGKNDIVNTKTDLIFELTGL